MQLHIVIYGRVQGVLFRRYAKEKASDLGLVGWIKNNQDGSVETEAEGAKEDLEKFLSWCRKGPSFAKVERMEVKWDKGSGKFKTFEVVYG